MTGHECCCFPLTSSRGFTFLIKCLSLISIIQTLAFFKTLTLVSNNATPKPSFNSPKPNTSFNNPNPSLNPIPSRVFFLKGSVFNLIYDISMAKLDMVLVFGQEFAIPICMEISNEGNISLFPINISLNIFLIRYVEKRRSFKLYI